MGGSYFLRGGRASTRAYATTSCRAPPASDVKSDYSGVGFLSFAEAVTDVLVRRSLGEGEREREREGEQEGYREREREREMGGSTWTSSFAGA